MVIDWINNRLDNIKSLHVKAQARDQGLLEKYTI